MPKWLVKITTVSSFKFAGQYFCVQLTIKVKWRNNRDSERSLVWHVWKRSLGSEQYPWDTGFWYLSESAGTALWLGKNIACCSGMNFEHPPVSIYQRKATFFHPLFHYCTFKTEKNNDSRNCLSLFKRRRDKGLENWFGHKSWSSSGKKGYN